jgi:hypothetical protein
MGTPFYLKPRFVKNFFLGLSITLTLATYLRLKWSWPDVTWQSAYWIIGDIDNLMAGNLSKVTWFEFANREWSLNGWRWLSYLNAKFFSWNMAYELLMYSLTVLGIFLLILLSITNKFFEWSWRRVFLLLTILMTLFNFAGAGARGMELGTYIGIFFTVSLFVIAFSEYRNLVLSIFLPPMIIFVFSGGYAIATTVALSSLLFIVLLKLKSFENLPNLKIASLASVVSLFIYVFVFLSQQRQGPSSMQTFFEYLQEHPFYPIKFLFYSPQGGLITIQSLEGLTSNEFSIVTLCISIFLLFLYLFCLIYSILHLRNAMLLPLSLLLYSIGTSITIMVTRPTGDFGMLSPWYSLHLKVGIVGCLWLLFIFSSIRDLKLVRCNWIPSTTVFLLIPILLFANSVQWERQPSERVYFQEIKKVTLFPETMAADPDGLTPLKIGFEDSKYAISVLKRHKIGVYRDAGKARGEFLSEGAFLRLGENFSDGWVGLNPTYLFEKGACNLIQFELTNVPKVIENEVSLTVDEKLVKMFKITSSPYVLKIARANEISSVSFNFAKNLVPAENGLGPDLRGLSAYVQVKCEK